MSQQELVKFCTAKKLATLHSHGKINLWVSAIHLENKRAGTMRETGVKVQAKVGNEISATSLIGNLFIDLGKKGERVA